MKKYLLSALMLLTYVGILTSYTGVAAGQGQTGQIFGTVTDASGAVMPGVKVTLSSPALIQPLIQTTSSSGTYQFPNITIGVYSVKFEQAGYNGSLRENIRVDIGFNAQVNVQLQVGAIQQTVEVTSSAPVVDTQSTAQSQEISNETLEGLPVARSFFNEVNLSPGVQNPAKDVGGAQNLNQPNFIALGAIPGQNRYFYDGADLAPAGGGNTMWVDYNTVQEMQVQSGGADATAQTSGMAINMAVKSGSDRFHGSFHDFEEGQTFESDNIGKGTPLRNALAFTGASPGNPLTHFRDIGGDIGGPIKKGKLWFWGDFGDNGIWVAADKVYNPSADCAAIAANQQNYSFASVRSCEFAFPTYIKAYAYKIGWAPFHNNTFTLLNEYSVKQVLYNGLTPLVPLESTRPQNSACHGIFHWGGLADIADMPATVGAKGNTPFWDCGWPVLWKFDDQQIINDRWIVDVAYFHYIKRNQFALQTPTSYNTAIQLENASGAIQKSNIAVTTFQPMQNFKIASTYTLPNFWGGTHNLKFAYNWYRYENCCTDNAGAEAQEIYSSGTGTPFSSPLAVNLYRYGYEDQFLHENQAYVQDTFTRKNWTFNAGVRWDMQWDNEGGFTVPASPYQGQLTRYTTPTDPNNPAATSIDCNAATAPTPCNRQPFLGLPAATFKGANSPVTWNTFAPRIGVAYNLLGKGTTVLKASFGQYYDQRTAGQLSDVYNTIGAGTTQQFVQYNWNGAKDANGNPLMTGVDLRTQRTSGANYNKADPSGAGANPNSVDPNIKDPRTTEFTAGASQQLGQGFGITVTYTWRYFDRFIWNQINNITSANFSPCQTSPTAAVICQVTPTTTFSVAATPCPTTVAPTYPTQCVPVTVFVPNVTLTTPYTVTNEPDYHRTYQGVSVVVRKQLNKRWSFDGNFTAQTNRQFYTAPDSYQDPTNIAQLNGSQYSPTASPGGGFPISISVNARWNTKFGGTYKLPWWGIGVSAIDDISQGYPYLSAINVSSRPNQAAGIAVLIAKPGDQRLPTVQNLNGRVDKTFTFKERVKVIGSLDIYNIFNSNTILGMQPNQNSANANYIDYILSPRLLRLGVKISF